MIFSSFKKKVATLRSAWHRTLLKDITEVKHDTQYNDYYRVQIQQSVGKIDKNAQFRYERIIGHLLKHSDLKDLSSKAVLCIGCRNEHELLAFDRAGFGDVIGIDLFSFSPRVFVMDMHNLRFQDNEFDVIYSADSLEHSHTPTLAIANMVRVTKPGGYICISTPLQWRRSLGRENEDISQLADCQDFVSPQEVYDLFGKIKYKKVFEEMYKSPDGANNLLAIISVVKE